jgi:PAS domain S-box-containing protein
MMNGCTETVPSLSTLSSERFAAVLNSITDGVFTVDENWRITCFNRAAEAITGFKRSEAIGRFCYEIFRTNICKEACALRYTLETGRPVVELMVYIKNTEGTQVPVSISTAPFRNERGKLVGGVETFRDLRQIEQLRKEVSKTYTFEDIISKSDNMKDLFNILPTIAESDSTVLITGESGVGKELLARAIHNLSGRSRHTLVTVNCAGFPETLIEAELFGYEAGAFTGALKSKKGRFALAENGTLFLDEIGDLPLPIQAKLLRVLQEKTYEPLGGTRTIKADVRFVAATNHVLTDMVKKGQFREDLYYRINIMELWVPPLRERLADVPLIIDRFIQQLSAVKGKNVAGVSPEVLRLLMAYDFPGNVRELKNIVEHGFVLCQGSLIKVEHLPEWLHPSPIPAESAGSLKEIEKQFILSTLKKNKWNRLATARQLGIHKTTLFRKIHKLGIPLPDTDGRSATSR